VKRALMTRRVVAQIVVAVATATTLAAVVPGASSAPTDPTLELISVIADGTSGTGNVSGSAFFPGGVMARTSISADCRFVVFDSESSSLDPAYANPYRDVFIRDRTGATRVLARGNDVSSEPAISANGRYVVFWSLATDLVPGEVDTNGYGDIFEFDRQTGTVKRVSASSSGEIANSVSHFAGVSADGRYVSFLSNASNLVSGDTNNNWDVFRRDMVTAVTERASVDAAGTEIASGATDQPSISADGTRVVFVTGGFPASVYVRDFSTGQTILASAQPDGRPSGFNASYATISPDGNFVAWRTQADDLVLSPPERPGYTNDVFLRNLATQTTIRVTQGNGDSWAPAVSRDGKKVAFISFASDIVSGPASGWFDVYLFDTASGTTRLVSAPVGGGLANGSSASPSISDDGSAVYFESQASNLVPLYLNGNPNIFLWAQPYAGGCSPANAPPVSVNDTYNTNEDTALNVAAPGVLANDTDAELNPLTAALVTGPKHGNVTLNADGSFTYTPVADYFGTDSFTYVANDGKANGNEATVSIAVEEVNDPPRPVDDAATVDKGTNTGVLVDVLANDAPGPPNEASQTLTIDSVGTPGHGTAVIESGKIRYVPTAGYVGPDSFTYVVRDDGTSHGVPDPKTATATVSITVDTINQPPVAVDDAAQVDQNANSGVLVDVLANDTPGPADEASQTLTIDSVGTPGHGTAVIESGKVRYVPTAGYVGPDSFTYVVRDNGTSHGVPDPKTATATVSITVRPVGADLSTELTVSNRRPRVGDQLTLTARVSNAGPNDAAGVTVLLPVPFGSTFVSASSSAYDVATDTWTLNVSSGATRELRIVATLDEGSPVDIVAQIMTSNQPDPDSYPGNSVVGEDDTSILRVTPRDIWVNNNGTAVDGRDGKCTLIEAITAANTDTASGSQARECAAGDGADVIHLQVATTYVLSDVVEPSPPDPFGLDLGGTGLPGVQSAITIEGNDSIVRRNSLPSTPEFRLFHVTDGGDLTLRHLSVAEGHALIGGAIWAQGHARLQLEGVGVITSTAGSFGGGVASTDGAVTSLTDSYVQSNRAPNGAGIGAIGGGLFLAGTRVLFNLATGLGGGMYVGSETFDARGSRIYENAARGSTARAGGVAINCGTSATLVDVAVTTNTSDGDAGGIYNCGDLAMWASTIGNNSAARDGGGLYNAGVATLNDLTITRNDARLGGGIANQGVLITINGGTLADNNAYFGGAIDSDADLRVRDTSFARNTASVGGAVSSRGPGHVASFTNTTMSANKAFFSGGAISLSGAAGRLILDQSVLSDNVAEYGSGGAIVNGSPGQIKGDPAVVVAGNLVLSDTVVSGNTANIPTAQSAEPIDGGGGIATYCGSISLIRTSLQQNATASSGSRVAVGGALLASCDDPRGSVVSITGDSRIAVNTASGGVGGGLFASGQVSLQMTDAHVVSNRASYGGGLDLFAVRGVTIARSEISYNSASVGGGLFTYATQDSLDAVSISNNTAGVDNPGVTGVGGGVYNSGGSLSLTNSTVRDNIVYGGPGGGIANVYSVHDRPILAVIDSTISGNTAPVGDGGGIWNQGEADLHKAVLAGNEAVNGAGIFNVAPAAFTTIEDSTLEGGRAYFSGGAAVNPRGATLFVQRSTLSANTAAVEGGAIENQGKFEVQDSTVSGNKLGTNSSGIGAGIYNYGGSTVIVRSTITANDGLAGGVGNGVFSRGADSTLISDSIVAGNLPIGPQGDCRASMPIERLGANLFATGTGCPLGAEDVGVAPAEVSTAVLGPLADNGGPTKTHALIPSGPAVDAAGPCIGVDQRSLPRDVDGDGDGLRRCDIGAYEQQSTIHTPAHVDSIDPASRLTNSGAFQLTVNGWGFGLGTYVTWDGAPQPTTVQSRMKLVANIPASAVATTRDISTAIVRVAKPDGMTSRALPFTAVSAKVAAFETSLAEPGQAVGARSGPTAPSVTAGLTNNTAGSALAVLTAARYGTNPTPGTIFTAGGMFDLRVVGADPSDVLRARVYYASSITGAIEADLKLRYWNGSTWALVRGSGGADPVKSTVDNADGTGSGGRFDVVFDATSTPKITELGGTVFAAAPNAAEMVSALMDKTLAFLRLPPLQAALKGRLVQLANALTSRNLPLACSALAGYVWAVNLLPTPVLATPQKAELVADATQLRQVLGCP
jgi:uncharacterized repeat protein (TIGR01451 family)